jgi:hypothetical protein
MLNRLFTVIFCLIVTACAGVNQMAIKKDSKTIDTNLKSILLMSIKLSRPEASRYTPHPLAVRFEKINQKGEIEAISFQVDKEAGATDSELSNKYYMRMALEPGEYKLHTIFGNANAFPFNGFFQAPLLTNITVQKNAIVYIGEINALLRPRKENEFRAGSVVPLIDQAVTGVSSGTFDIEIKNAEIEDIGQFQSNFPILVNQTIQTSILPAWDREKAESWWHGNGEDKNANK